MGRISNQDTAIESTSLPELTTVQNLADEDRPQTPVNIDSSTAIYSSDRLVEALNAKQRKGDWRVFHYYSLRMGIRGMLIFFVLMTIFTFLYGFPRT